MSADTALPNEILLDIFQQSLPLQLDEKGRRTFQTIRSVSSRWRFICLSSPVLWSSVSVTWDSSEQSNDGGDIGALEAWFLRAGPSVPLKLLYKDDSPSTMRAEDKAALKALVRRYQPRWRCLSLYIESDCFWSALTEPPSSNWIGLHTLELWTWDIMHVGAEKASRAYDVLEKITTLRRLLVENGGYTYTRQFGPSDLAELRITCSSFGIDEFHLISSYNHLTTLALVFPLGLAASLSPEYHLILPSLLSFAYTAHNLYLLRRFTTPSLVDFDIQLCAEKDHYFDDEFLSGFLSRCTDALQSIMIDSRSDEIFIAQMLPEIGIRRSLKRLTIDIWPLKLASSEGRLDDWFLDLQDLTISVEASEQASRSEALELERMQDLAAFLLRWKERGRQALVRLTIHKRSTGFKFPYELFEDVALGQLSVMVPW